MENNILYVGIYDQQMTNTLLTANHTLTVSNKPKFLLEISLLLFEYCQYLLLLFTWQINDDDDDDKVTIDKSAKC